MTRDTDDYFCEPDISPTVYITPKSFPSYSPRSCHRWFDLLSWSAVADLTVLTQLCTFISKDTGRQTDERAYTDTHKQTGTQTHRRQETRTNRQTHAQTITCVTDIHAHTYTVTHTDTQTYTHKTQTHTHTHTHTHTQAQQMQRHSEHR